MVVCDNALERALLQLKSQSAVPVSLPFETRHSLKQNA